MSLRQKFKKNLIIGFVAVALLAMVGLMLFFWPKQNPLSADLPKPDEQQTKKEPQFADWDGRKGPRGWESSEDLSEDVQSDIQSDENCAIGIVLDAPGSGDLAKVKKFMEQLENVILEEVQDAGTGDKTHSYYILDPAGKKARVEIFYIVSVRTDKQTAAYFSENIVSINVATGTFEKSDLPEEKMVEKLIEQIKAGKANKFSILNASEPFPTDWLSGVQTP